MALLSLDALTISIPFLVNSNFKKFDLGLIFVLVMSPSFSIRIVILEITLGLRSVPLALWIKSHSTPGLVLYVKSGIV